VTGHSTTEAAAQEGTVIVMIVIGTEVDHRSSLVSSCMVAKIRLGFLGCLGD